MGKKHIHRQYGQWQLTNFGIERSDGGYDIGRARLNDTRTEHDQKMAMWLVQIAERSHTAADFDNFYKIFLAALDHHRRDRSGPFEPLELAKTRQWCLHLIEQGQDWEARFDAWREKKRGRPANPECIPDFCISVSDFAEFEAGQ